MEEKEVIQKELFREFSQAAKRPGRFAWFKKPVSFRPLIFIFSYEKLIFLIISLLIILTIIFSLGVEQGKRIAPRAKGPLDTALPLAAVPAPLNKTISPGFTIQLATFLEKNSAEKEITNLNNKGYHSFMVNSGKYYLVCFGSFANKEEAKLVLAKLKTIYKDAYIKKKQEGK